MANFRHIREDWGKGMFERQKWQRLHQLHGNRNLATVIYNQGDVSLKLSRQLLSSCPHWCTLHIIFWWPQHSRKLWLSLCDYHQANRCNLLASLTHSVRICSISFMTTFLIPPIAVPHSNWQQLLAFPCGSHRHSSPPHPTANLSDSPYGFTFKIHLEPNHLPPDSPITQAQASTSLRLPDNML